MKKLKVEITREDEYEIEIEETIWGEDELADWSNHFHPIESVEELADTLATEITRNGYDGFIEGFGYLTIFRQNGSRVNHFVHREGKLQTLPEQEYCKGIKVTLKSYDDYYSANIEEITEPKKSEL